MENEKKTGDKYSKLAGNTLIFAISSFSSKLLTLLVQPFLLYFSQITIYFFYIYSFSKFFSYTCFFTRFFFTIYA